MEVMDPYSEDLEQGEASFESCQSLVEAVEVLKRTLPAITPETVLRKAKLEITRLGEATFIVPLDNEGDFDPTLTIYDDVAEDKIIHDKVAEFGFLPKDSKKPWVFYEIYPNTVRKKFFEDDIDWSNLVDWLEKSADKAEISRNMTELTGLDRVSDVNVNRMKELILAMNERLIGTPP